MSVAMSLYNKNGIVMCADKLIKANLIKEDNTSIEYTQTKTEQKLFLIEDRYGLSYTGTSSLENTTTSALIKEYISKNKIKDEDPQNWLLRLTQHFSLNIPKDGNIVFIMCGYYNNNQIILSSNTNESENVISHSSEISTVLFSGEIYFIEYITNNKLAPLDFSKFTMQDSIDFLVFANETIANLMNFGQFHPTVSKECDILVIDSDNARWIKHILLHISKELSI